MKPEKIFTSEFRNTLSAAYEAAIFDQTEINSNFFLNPASYKPYFDFLGDPLDLVQFVDKVSPVTSAMINYLALMDNKASHKVLDYACGIPVLVHCSSMIGFQSCGFDRWIQLRKSVAATFLNQISERLEKAPQTGEALLIDSLQELVEFSPTIICVSGFWIEDIELYNLSSLEYVLSDPLYNSGRVKNQGIYHYKPEWQFTPKEMGLSLVESFQYLDVYKVAF